MHLAHSAISTNTINQHLLNNKLQEPENSEIILRYQAYQITCSKYAREIAAIQKYMPGWVPEFK